MNLTSSSKTRRWPHTLTCGVNASLFILGIAAANSASVDLAMHKRLGYGMTVLVIIHVVLHRNWLARQFSKRPLVPHWKLGLDITLLTVAILLISSGLIVALIYAPAVSQFHRLSVNVFGLLVVVHLVANRRWILGQFVYFQHR